MPLPLLAGIALGVGALFGAAGHSVANDNNKEADTIYRNSKQWYDNTNENFLAVKSNCENALQTLGTNKKNVLDTSFKKFAKSFSKVKSIQIQDSIGILELGKFAIDYDDTLEIQKINNDCNDIIAAGTMGGVAGATLLLATGGTAAITGITSSAIVAGQGLAFAGGAAVSGMGMGAVGSGFAVAGAGLSATIAPLATIAAPVILFTGISASLKSEENLSKARLYESEVEEAIAEMEILTIKCNAIAEKTNIHNELLTQLNDIFTPCTKLLEDVTNNIHRRSFKKEITSKDLTSEERELLAVSRAVAGAIKALIDTPLLTENSEVNTESQIIHEQTQKQLPILTQNVQQVTSYSYTRAGGLNNNKFIKYTFVAFEVTLAIILAFSSFYYLQNLLGSLIISVSTGLFFLTFPTVDNEEKIPLKSTLGGINLLSYTVAITSLFYICSPNIIFNKGMAFWLFIAGFIFLIIGSKLMEYLDVAFVFLENTTVLISRLVMGAFAFFSSSFLLLFFCSWLKFPLTIMLVLISIISFVFSLIFALICSRSI